MATLTQKNLKLHYHISGNGPALILIGGMGMPLEGWSLQLEPLSKQFTIVRFDNRGCGRSFTPDTPYTVQEMAEDVLQLMDHLNIRSAHMMGLSMGGFIALQLSLVVPHQVNSLILAHTAPAIPAISRQRIRLWQKLKEEGIADHLIAMEQLLWIFPEKAMEKDSVVQTLINNIVSSKDVQSIEGFRGQAKACETFDITNRLPEIKAPTLLISSRDDISIPLAHTKKLEELSGFRKMKIFDQGGHATHLIHAESFNQTVMDFLANLS